jgi:hypothetical protein
MVGGCAPGPALFVRAAPVRGDGMHRRPIPRDSASACTALSAGVGGTAVPLPKWGNNPVQMLPFFARLHWLVFTFNILNSLMENSASKKSWCALGFHLSGLESRWVCLVRNSEEPPLGIEIGQVNQEPSRRAP